MSEERCKQYKNTKPLFNRSSITTYTSVLHRKALINELREQQMLKANLLSQEAEMEQEEIDALYEQYLNMENSMDTDEPEECSLCNESKVTYEGGILHCSTESCLNIPIDDKLKPDSKYILEKIKQIKEGHKYSLLIN